MVRVLRLRRNGGLAETAEEAYVMGTFEWPVRIAGVGSERSEVIEATVDTGAFYSVIPERLLRDLGVERSAKRRMRLADGRVLDADIGEARITVNGESVTTLVVFGEDDAPSLLGAYTLEGLALAVDPVDQRLIPHDLLPL
jgi:clan AA aspartic protease